MADFSQAQNIGVNTGSAPSATTGVSDAGAAKGAIVADLAAGMTSIFARSQPSSGGFTAKQQFDMAKEGQGNVVTQAYMERASSISEAVESGELDSARGTAELRSLFRKMAAGNPQYVDDLVSAHQAFTSTPGLGKVVVEGTQRERDAQKVRSEGISAGWVDENASPEVQNLQVDAYQEHKFQGDQIARDTALINNTKAKIDLGTSKDQAEIAKLQRDVTELQSKATMKIAGMGVNWVRARTAGNESIISSNADVPAKEQQLTEKYNATRAEILSVGAGAPAVYTDNLLKQLEDQHNLDLAKIHGTMTDDEVRRQSTRIEANLRLLALKDPVIAKVYTASNLLQGSDVLLEAIAPSAASLQNFIENSSPSSTSILDVTNKDDPDKQKGLEDGLKMVSDNMDMSTRGQLPEATQAELVQATRKVLEGVGMTAHTPERIGEIDTVMNFLAQPRTGEYLAANSAQFADLKPQVQDALRPMTQQVKLKMDEELANYPEIQLEFSGQGVVFTMDGMKERNIIELAMEPNSTSEARRQAKRLNQHLAPLLNRVIRLHSHLDGNTDYHKMWESEIAPAFFPQPGLSKEDEEFLDGLL